MSGRLKQHEVDNFYLDNIKKLVEEKGTVRFLQIGAFDGVMYDELHDLIADDDRFTGLLIEPVPQAFGILKDSTYAQKKNWKFENVAIDDYKGMREMLTVPYELKHDSNVPPWVVGCSTLTRSNPLSGINCTPQEFASFKDKITRVTVDADDLNSVLDRHNFQDVDLVHIDAEGCDWKILRQFRFELHRPKIMHFEFFGMTVEEYNHASMWLGLYGYELTTFLNNTTAILNEKS